MTNSTKTSDKETRNEVVERMNVGIRKRASTSTRHSIQSVCIFNVTLQLSKSPKVIKLN